MPKPSPKVTKPPRKIRPTPQLVDDNELDDELDDDLLGEDAELVSLEANRLLSLEKKPVIVESDTEGDFLDRADDAKLSTNPTDKITNNMSSLESGSTNSTATTSAASYVVSHADLDSMLADKTKTKKLKLGILSLHKSPRSYMGYM